MMRLGLAFFLMGIMCVVIAMACLWLACDAICRGLLVGYIRLLIPPFLLAYAYLAFYAGATIFFELGR